jgi:hypothetical protein
MLADDGLLTTDCGSEQSSNLLLVFANTVILGFGIHGYIFVFSKTTCMF